MAKQGRQAAAPAGRYCSWWVTSTRVVCGCTEAGTGQGDMVRGMRRNPRSRHGRPPLPPPPSPPTHSAPFPASPGCSCRTGGAPRGRPPPTAGRLAGIHLCRRAGRGGKGTILSGTILGGWSPSRRGGQHGTAAPQNSPAAGPPPNRLPAFQIIIKKQRTRGRVAGAGEGHALALPAAQVHPLLPYLGFVACVGWRRGARTLSALVCLGGES